MTDSITLQDQDLHRELIDFSSRFQLEPESQSYAIQVYQEYMAATDKHVDRRHKSLYVRVSVFLSAKTSALNKRGSKNATITSFELTEFLSDEKFQLDEFIGALKDMIRVVSRLPSELVEELSNTVTEFSFFNKIYVKYCDLFSKLELAAHSVKDSKLYNNATAVKNIYWMLFALIHSNIFDRSMDIQLSVNLLGSLFVHMLENRLAVSNYLGQNSLNCQGQISIETEICGLLKIKDKNQFAEIKKRLTNFINDLIQRQVLAENWAEDSARLNLSCKRLDKFYQIGLELRDIDLRFFNKEREKSHTPAKFTPFQKQGVIYNKYVAHLKTNLNSQRVLDFTVKENAVANDKSKSEATTAVNFRKMQQSPYRTSKAVMASPITAAMELYNWLHEKTNRQQIFINGKYEENNLFKNSPLSKFFNILDAQTYHSIMHGIINQEVDKVIKEELKGRASKKGLFEDRKTIIINFYFSMLEEFIIREKKFQTANIDSLIKSSSFHKTLLAFVIETTYFVLNITTVDMFQVIKNLNLPIYDFYKINFKNLNFEDLVPLPLKKHFLQLEYQILSYHIWQKDSEIFVLETDNEMINRILHYASNLVSNLNNSIGVNLKFGEKVWELVKHIILQRRDLLNKRYIDQIVMSSLYGICKVINAKVKFQDIIKKYRSICVFGSTVFNTMVFKCRLDNNQFEDIISFYNKTFVLELKDKIRHYGTLKVDGIYGQVKPSEAKIEPSKTPLKTLISTPFSFYSKHAYLGSPANFRSPTTYMMKMGSQKVPVKAKRIIDFKNGNLNREPIKVFEVTDDVKEMNIQAFNNQLNKFR